MSLRYHYSNFLSFHVAIVLPILWFFHCITVWFHIYLFLLFLIICQSQRCEKYYKRKHILFWNNILMYILMVGKKVNKILTSTAKVLWAAQTGKHGTFKTACKVMELHASFWNCMQVHVIIHGNFGNPGKGRISGCHRQTLGLGLLLDTILIKLRNSKRLFEFNWAWH